MANQTNGNQIREDEIIIRDQLRDGKWVKNIFPKIGGRLRLAHEENDQLSITTEIVRYDQTSLLLERSPTSPKDRSRDLELQVLRRLLNRKGEVEIRLGAVLHDRRPLIRGFAQPRAL